MTRTGDVIEEDSRGVTDAMVEQIVSGAYCVHDVPAFESVQITPRIESLTTTSSRRPSGSRTPP